MSRLGGLLIATACTFGCTSEFEAATDAAANERRVFATSEEYPVGFGGVNAADARCTQHAGELGGTWRAWIGTEAAPAASRMNPFDGPYRVIGGAVVAESFADLIDGSLLAPINRDETGIFVSAQSRAWTGTRPDGSWSGKDCSGWVVGSESLVASAGRVVVSGEWTDADLTCDSLARFYCIEQ